MLRWWLMSAFPALCAALSSISTKDTRVLSVNSDGLLRREDPENVLASPPDAVSFWHPPWLHKCKSIYLDVGSHIGVQVRKFFEPERYRGASVLPLFDLHFGSPLWRSQSNDENGLCALGLEPNPKHHKHLDGLASNYLKKGWYVHFYPYAAWREEGTLLFDTIAGASDTRAAHLVLATGGPANVSKETLSVRTVDLAQFVKSLPGGTVKLMKMDIAGAEYATIARMIDEQVLCQGSVDAVVIKAHRITNSSYWTNSLSYQGIERTVSAADCYLRKHTALVSMGDESYYKDPPWQPPRTTLPIFQRFHVFFVFLSISVLIFLVILGSSAFVRSDKFQQSSYGQAADRWLHRQWAHFIGSRG